jgi:hypothetical protein
MLIVRCKNCNTEIESHSTKSKCCGCSNQTCVRDDSISAMDLSLVVIVQGEALNKRSKSSYLTSSDLMWQEERKKRGVKRLNFEVR